MGKKLLPAQRRTAAVEFLSDRSCPSGKRTYDKKSALSQSNKESRRTGGKKLHVYHCSQCNNWHLGRNVDYMKGYKRK